MNDEVEQSRDALIVHMEGKINALTSACVLLIGLHPEKETIIELLDKFILHASEEVEHLDARDIYIAGVKEIVSSLQAAAVVSLQAESLRDLKPDKDAN